MPSMSNISSSPAAHAALCVSADYWYVPGSGAGSGVLMFDTVQRSIRKTYEPSSETVYALDKNRVTKDV